MNHEYPKLCPSYFIPLVFAAAAGYFAGATPDFPWWATAIIVGAFSGGAIGWNIAALKEFALDYYSLILNRQLKEIDEKRERAG